MNNQQSITKITICLIISTLLSSSVMGNSLGETYPKNVTTHFDDYTEYKEKYDEDDLKFEQPSEDKSTYGTATQKSNQACDPDDLGREYDQPMNRSETVVKTEDDKTITYTHTIIYSAKFVETRNESINHTTSSGGIIKVVICVEVPGTETLQFVFTETVQKVKKAKSMSEDGFVIELNDVNNRGADSSVMDDMEAEVGWGGME